MIYPIPCRTYLLSINDLSRGYLMLLSGPTSGTRLQLSPPNSTQRSRLLIRHSPIRHFFFLAFGPVPAPGCEGGASPAGPGGVDPQEQRLHQRRRVQEGRGCDAEIEAASAPPGDSLP